MWDRIERARRERDSIMPAPLAAPGGGCHAGGVARGRTGTGVHAAPCRGHQLLRPLCPTLISLGAIARRPAGVAQASCARSAYGRPDLDGAARRPRAEVAEIPDLPPLSGGAQHAG